MIGSGLLLPRLRNKWRRRPPESEGSDGKGPGPTARGRDSPRSEFEHLSLDEYEGVRVRVDGMRIIKVYVPDGKGPGHEVTVRGCGGPDDGRTFRAVVPPRRHWSFQCRDGVGGEHRPPRPFFLIRPVDPTVPAFFLVRRSAVDDDPATAERPNAARRVGFQDQGTPSTVCPCAPSEGVFDSRCPVHGTDAPRCCPPATRPHERDDGPEGAGPPVGASLATPLLDDERRRQREALDDDERHDAELARALGESERHAAEEERRLRREEELVWNAVGKTRAAGEEEARRNEEDLVMMALANSLADVSLFRSVAAK